MFKDYYAVLGVPPSSSAEVVRKAFKRMALLSHPDKTGFSDTSNWTMEGDGELAGAMSNTNNSAMQSTLGGTFPEFTDIKEAYDVLSDVPRRYLYDLTYKQAVDRQQQLQQEAMSRQKEKERERREREAHIQKELELAESERERELERGREREREKAREEARERERVETENAASSRTDKHDPTAPEKSGLRAPPAPPMTGGTSAKDRRSRRKWHPASSDSTRFSSATSSASRSTLANTARQPKMVNFSVAMLDATYPRSRGPRGYPLPPPEELGLSQDYYNKRAIQKAVHIFFSDVLPLVDVGGENMI